MSWKIKRKQRYRGETGEGKKTMTRSVKAEEASPGLDPGLMITSADCISYSVTVSLATYWIYSAGVTRLQF